MLKKTITYSNYNDEQITEDFYFNLNKAELAEMELSINGGMTEWIKQIINSSDNSQLVKIFKEMILKAYGVKSVDGKRFIKSEELRTEFEQTEAYVELFMELSTDDKAAINFVNGIIPSDVEEKKEALEKKNNEKERHD